MNRHDESMRYIARVMDAEAKRQAKQQASQHGAAQEAEEIRIVTIQEFAAVDEAGPISISGCSRRQRHPGEL